MGMFSFKITAATVIRQARGLFEEDWQRACAYLQGVLGCDFATVVQFFTHMTLVDGTEPGTMLPVPDPEASKFVEEMREHYHSRINHRGHYLRPCAEVLSIGPFWMAKELGINLGYPRWDEEPRPSMLENGININPIRGTCSEHYVLEDEVLFRIDGRSIIFDPCDPPPPWMVCESPKAALTAWEATHEWLDPRGWVQEVRDQMPKTVKDSGDTSAPVRKTFSREESVHQGTVRHVYPGVTRGMVEVAYQAHRNVILAPWRGSCREYTTQGDRQMVRDLELMVRACQPFVPADWYTRIMGDLGKAAHDLKFDGSRADALVDIECGIIQMCHEFIAEATQVLGLTKEFVQKYEVRA